MKLKSIITVLLLLFVAISIVVLFINENRAPKTEVKKESMKDGETLQAGSRGGSKIIVYYFHNTKRCRTCRRIEALTKKAVETGFPEDLENGKVELRILNVQVPENEHFVLDYNLTTNAVVVSLLENGSEVSWKRLDRVWELVNNEEAFIRYIQDGTYSIMAGDRTDG